nr:reverse transcriptase domain-containing protein [Tanacetum cinerariifolium]
MEGTEEDLPDSGLLTENWMLTSTVATSYVRISVAVPLEDLHSHYEAHMIVTVRSGTSWTARGRVPVFTLVGFGVLIKLNKSISAFIRNSATAAIVFAVSQANDHDFGGIQVPKQKRNTGTKEMEVILFRTPGTLFGGMFGNHRNKILFDEISSVKSMIFDNVISSSFHWCRSRLTEHQDSIGGQLISFLADLCINKFAPSDVSDEEIKVNKKGKANVGDKDLSKPFKEVLKCPFTSRIVEFSSPEHRMPSNAKIYDGTGNLEDHVGRFVGMGNQEEWPMPVWCRMLQQTLDGKIIWRANETLPNFKERWLSEPNAILNAHELMKISSFMSSHKCPELSKRFSNNIPKTVDEMLKRVDDYLRSKEAFRNTELPKETVRDSFRVRQVESSGEGCKANGKRGTAEQRSLERKSDQHDLSEEALVVKGKVEGYLIWRIPVDEGASVEIMFEQCFNMLHPSIWSRLVETQTTMSGFSREQVKPLGKIESIRVGKKQAIELPKEIKPQEKVSLIEQVLVKPTYQEQLVVIGKGLPPEGSTQLKNLLKKNKDIFTWELADMTGVPKRIIKHSLNDNPLVTSVSQKRRVFFSEKSQAITWEVAEWLKAGIIRPVKYPTWISNPILVKKVDRSWRICIEFKNINAVCPKDYYPLPEIDSKIESAWVSHSSAFMMHTKATTKCRWQKKTKRKPPSTRIKVHTTTQRCHLALKMQEQRTSLVDEAFQS